MAIRLMTGLIGLQVVSAFFQMGPLTRPLSSHPIQHQSLSHPQQCTKMMASTSIVQSSAEYSDLKQLTVIKASSGKAMSLGDAFPAGGAKKTVVAFLTHWGDFNSFELAQKLKHYAPELDQAKAQVVCVGIGTVDGAKEFSKLVGFPLDKLYADEDGTAYKKLGFYAGFGASLPINPYAKLLPMLMGIGSPGTIQAVLRGYVGDRNADASWTKENLGNLVEKSAFDVLGTNGARPFEVATVRLQNMISIIPNWEKLAPPNKELITQQGGVLIFEGRKLINRFDDKGILVYTPIDEILAAVGASK